jgi:hypothetical protein
MSTENRRWISYFQSIITVGVITNGNTMEEAEVKAKEMMKGKQDNGDFTMDLHYGVFQQTPFELSEIESYGAEIEPVIGNSDSSFRVEPTEDVRGLIAEKLGKEARELTSNDMEDFVKGAIEAALKKP